ncbi:hypothetical protein MHH52_21780 [Paenibacillus sp. FSL K6-0276]|uniref:hypothetical protein n=1 Tax=Paenibacillus sp. FSL K6-0276 TaxID=2921450 RepID=UPI0030ECD264
MADFNEQLPDWLETGIEPPTSKKNEGWQVDDKPPAAWWNWLLNRTYKVLVEIRSVFTAHKADTTIHITAAERTSWNAKETTTGAQAKANAVQTNLTSHATDTTVHITAAERTAWNAKAPTTLATQSAAGLMSGPDKTKLDGIAVGANNYTHPATHPPSIIAQDVSNRFVSDAEKTAWNAKASTAVATPNTAGLESAADKAKLDGIAAGANAYVHPNHTGDVTSTGDGVTAIAAGVIVNADINAAAAIDASKIGTGAVSNAEYGYLDGVTSGIQGQLNSKAPLATTPQQTTADITYYVRTDGSDSNNGLANTAAGAFKTISKAISVIPQVVNHAININVAAGTYSDDIYLGGRSGSGEIKITGASSLVTTHVASSISLLRCTCRITVIGFVFSKAGPNLIFSSPEVTISYCTISSAVNEKGFIVDSAKAYFVGCSVSNRSPAFQAHTNSEVLIQTCSGSGNSYAVTAAYGGKAVLDASNISSTNKNSAYAGGMIMDNNSCVINPWGDNTPTSRTGIFAGKSASQAVSASVWTKVAFSATSYDHLSEFNKTTSTFIAKQKGMYLVTASVFLDSVPAGFSAQLRLYLNYSTNMVLDERTAVNATSMIVKGAVAMYMDAGHTLELYVMTTGATNINLANDVTAFQINRMA